MEVRLRASGEWKPNTVPPQTQTVPPPNPGLLCPGPLSGEPALPSVTAVNLEDVSAVMIGRLFGLLQLPWQRVLLGGVI